MVYVATRRLVAANLWNGGFSFCLILSARNCLSFSSFYSVCVVKHFAVAKKLIALTIWLKYQRLNNDVIRSIFGNKYNI